MKFEFIPCTLKYALLARKRSKTDGGTLFFALIDYYTFGKKQTFENEGMQVLFDLFVGDIDEFLAGRKKLSETNANNASCKGNADKSNNKKTKRGRIAAKAISGSSVDSAVDGNAADSSDDGGDSVTDDDDSSLSADNIKPPEVASKPNDRGKIQMSLKAELHISDDKNGSDRNDGVNSMGTVDVVNKSNDCSKTQGSLNISIETSDVIDRSEFNATQHAKDDSSDGSDRNGRCESMGAVDVVSESYDRSGSEVSLKNAIETNDDTDRNGRIDSIDTVYVTSNRNNRSDSIDAADVVSESSDRSNDHESVVMPDVTNNRSNRVLTNSAVTLDTFATTAALDSSESAESIVHAASVSSKVATTEDDISTTFVRLRDLYNKTGDNESRAFELWQRLSAKERADALSYAETIAGNSGYRSYLYVFLRDKEWLKPKANSH